MHTAPSFPIGTPVDLGGERRRWFSYQDIENIALHHRREVMACRYDAIVGLARGGLYLATMLSQMTGIAHATAYYDRAAGTAHLHNLPAHRPMRLLLAEDVAGKGHTLERVRHALEQRGASVDLMVICWDDLSRHVPDYYGVKLAAGERYLFPWERSQLAHTSPERTGHDDLAGWLTAFDLDGVFLEDVPVDLYASDLQAALAARDNLPALPAHPDWRSGGLMLQMTPEAAKEGPPEERPVNDDWERLSLLMKTAEDVELVDTALAPQTLLWRLFHEDEVRVHPAEPIAFRCDCDGGRIAQILRGYTVQEREGLADEDGIIRASCEFCGIVHQIMPDALA